MTSKNASLSGLEKSSLAICGVAAALAAFAQSAHAQDECTSAVTLTLNTPTAFSTTNATPSTGVPLDSFCPNQNLLWTATAPDVWFKWTAPSDGVATFSTCNSDTLAIDTSIALYVGTCTNLIQVGCNGDLMHNNPGGCNSTDSKLANFAVTAGTTYYVRVAGIASDFGVAIGNGSITVKHSHISAWGDNQFNQCDVPAGVTNPSKIVIGDTHGLAVKSDGTIVGWGGNNFGQITIPTGLTSPRDIAAGQNFSVAARSNGTLAAWGSSTSNRTVVPTTVTDASKVAAGAFHGLALRTTGAVVAWGAGTTNTGASQNFGQSIVPSAANSGITAIAAGNVHSLALRSTGAVIAWGAGSNNTGVSPHFGQSIVPSGALSNVTKIAAGYYHSVALRSDGTVVCWGAGTTDSGALPHYGQSIVPNGLAGVIDIAAGSYHTVALRSNGTVAAWGLSTDYQTSIPTAMGSASMIAAGGKVSIARYSPCAGGTPTTYYRDADGDGFGDPVVTQTSCATAPTGYVSNALDCNDALVTYVDADGDTYGAGAPAACGVASGSDCNDADAAVNPAASEICDALNTDENCNGVADNLDALALDAGKTTFYVDADGDTYTLSTTARFCDQPATGYRTVVSAALDCNDSNAAINPGASEICDALNTDENCNGSADNLDATALDASKFNFYRDQDNDTYTVANATRFCDIVATYRNAVSAAIDCNDTNAAINPGRSEICDAGNVDENCNSLADNADAGALDAGKTNFFADADNDTYTVSPASRFCDLPTGYRVAVSSPIDCNDADAAINPAATEICDANDVDENCNSVADNADSGALESSKSNFYADGDSDTYTVTAASRFCDLPTGFRASASAQADCNDAVAAINPGASEICDAANVDENCNNVADNADAGALDAGKSNFYADADSDTYTVAAATRFCDLPAGYRVAVSSAIDCNDANAAINPGASEICDAANVDENCNNVADNADAGALDAGKSNFYADADSDTYTVTAATRFCDIVTGYLVAASAAVDCDDAVAAINPGATELCDIANVDENCNNVADNADAGALESSKTDFFADADSDTYTVASATRFCDIVTGYLAAASAAVDCNDAVAAINPGASEICDANETDENCNNVADNADAGALDAGKSNFYADADSDTYTVAAATRFCDIVAGYLVAASAAVDCNDANGAINPGATELCDIANVDENCNNVADNADAGALESSKTDFFADADSDTYTVAAATRFCDIVTGYLVAASAAVDCDDASATIHPGAVELCATAAIDNNCDGIATDVDANAADKVGFFRDADLDGFTTVETAKFCSGTVNSGWLEIASASVDCDDASATIHPGAVELCSTSAIDNNCDGIATDVDANAADKVDFVRDADLDGFTVATTSKFCAGTVNSGWLETASASPDCDDASALVYPGADELCSTSTVDNNCDGIATDVDAAAADKVDFFRDADLDTYTVATTSKFCSGTVNSGWLETASASVDCNDADATIHPGAVENCANLGIDNNCDTVSASDEEAVDSIAYMLDDDQDGFGAGPAQKSCSPVPGRVANALDCNDGDATINPNGIETCANAGIDNNCNGIATLDAEAIDCGSFCADNDGDGFGAGPVQRACVNPVGHVPNGADCDDTQFLYADTDGDGHGAGAPAACGVASNDDGCATNADLIAPVTYFADVDNDGAGDSASTTSVCQTSAPAGFVAVAGDNCVSNAALQNPVTYFADVDGDGSGDAASSQQFCETTAPVGFSANSNDLCVTNADLLAPVTYYRDIDQDGAGDAADTSSVCETTAPVGFVAVAGDNCVNNAALQNPVTYFADVDNDGAGDAASSQQFCETTAPVGFSANSNDLCVSNADLLAPVTYFADVDGDGAGDAASTQQFCETTAPAGFVAVAGDNCVSNAALLNPVTYFADVDGDGFGAALSTTSVCQTSAPVGYVTDSSDCNDAALLYADTDGDGHGAGAAVACGVASNDDNCATNVDLLNPVTYFADVDADGAGDAADTTSVCQTSAPAGYVTVAGDNCVSNADLVNPVTYYRDVDTDGAGDAADTTSVCETTAPVGFVAVAGDNCVNNAALLNPVTYFADVDGDGFGAALSTTSVCQTSAPAGYITDSSDCDDAALLYADTDGDGHGAGAAIACGVASNDDNCATNVDLLNPVTYFRDIDQDGAGDAADTTSVCETTAPVGFVAVAGDNCVNNAALQNPVTYYADVDGDGFGSALSSTSICETSAPAGYITDSSDCNDAALLYADTDGDGHGAGAPAACGVASNDDLCASNADLLAPATYFRDVDNDGAGDAADTTSVCETSAPAGFVAVAGDNCVNNAALQNPVTYFADVDRDGYGNIASTISVCETTAPAGYTTDSTDCNDADATIHPGAVENCANLGIDNNCDTVSASDEEAVDSIAYMLDDDQDGFGAGPAQKSCSPVPGRVANALDCNDGDATINPNGIETCANAGIDNNCNGIATLDAEAIDCGSFCADNDGDGFGAGPVQRACVNPVGHVPNGADCDDTQFLYADTDGDGHGAGAPAACGVASNDDGCATNADLIAPVTYFADVDNDGAGDSASTTSVCQTSAPAGFVAVAGDNCVSNAALQNPVTYFADVDHDGFGAAGSTTSVCETSAPVGYVTDSSDCNDAALLYADTDGDGHGAGAPIACGVASNDDNCATNAALVNPVIYFADVDGDGFGAALSTTSVCQTSAPVGYVTDSSDCNDAALLYADTDGDGHGAGAPVACGVASNDDNCATNAALLAPVTYYRDADNDGAGDAADTTSVCQTSAPAGYTTNSADLCPTNAQLVTPNVFFADADHDGYGDFFGLTEICAVSAPAGFVTNDFDCDDTALLYDDADGDGHGAGAPTACGVTSNDDGCPFNAALLTATIYYADTDNDGAGDAAASLAVCETTAPAGYVLNANDGCPSNGALLAANTFYADIDRDGFGWASSPAQFCEVSAPIGFSSDSTDCNDRSLLYADTDGDGRGAGAPAACGVTSNDDACPDNAQLVSTLTYYADADQDGAGDPLSPLASCEMTAPTGYVDIPGDQCPANGQLTSPRIYAVDLDQDGFGNPTSTTAVCDLTAPAGYVANLSDCDDTVILYADTDNDGHGAGAPAACGVTSNDDGCPVNAALLAPITYYTDVDGDGAGNGAAPQQICETSAPVGFSTTTNDQCDNNAALLAPVTYYADVDGDGFGNLASTTSVCQTSAPVGYVANSTDCNDNALLYADTDGDGHGAGAAVACGVTSNDDACPTNAQLVTQATYYRDADGDGFGALASTTSVCETVAPAGYVANSTDCNDAALLYADTDGDGHGAGAPVACGVTTNDDLCATNAALLSPVTYYADVDNDGAGDAASTTLVCETTAPVGYVAVAGDNCVNNAALVNPVTYYRDADNDGFGALASTTSVCQTSAPAGYVTNSTDCNDAALLYADTDGDGHGAGAPVACGVTSNDDACPTNAQLVAQATYYRDADNDGFGALASTTSVCETSAPAGYVVDSTDCNDAALLYADTDGDGHGAGAPVACGVTSNDDACPTNAQLVAQATYYRDADSDGFGDLASTTSVCETSAPIGYVINSSDCNDAATTYADTDGDGHGAGRAVPCGVTSNDDLCPTNAALINPVTYFADVDNDGFGAALSTTSVCETSAPVGYVTDSSDCNDAALLYADTDGDGHGAGAPVACGVTSNDDACPTNAQLVAQATYYRDADNDGFGAAASSVSICEVTAPAGYVADSTDCNDSALLYADTDGDGHGAGAPVACGVASNDDNCATNAALLNPVTYYRDVDADGAGDATDTTRVCETTAPVGFVTVAGDNCVTNPDLVNPVTFYRDADNDGFGDVSLVISVCQTTAPAGHVSNSADCDDAALLYADTDGDGHGAGAPVACGVTTNDDGCPTNAQLLAPATYYRDADNDGAGDANDTTSACALPVGFVTVAGDTCPANGALLAPITYYADVDGDGAGDSASSQQFCETTAPAGFSATAGDGCPTDPAKTSPGTCGCGVADTDSDGDGVPNCNDGCPNDAAKTSPGTCGCGVADTDTDSDGRADCVDNCPSIANPDQLDCNANGTGDVCEIAAGTAQDCNSNGRIDTCDLASGASTDLDGSGKPDECEFVVGGSGYSSIQAAINAAPNGTIIKVAPGTWAPITVSNRAVTVQAIGSREATFIDGGSSSRAVEISGRNAARFTLRGFTIRNGRGAEGAGMLITDADPLVENCVFTANVATGLGGAVRAINSAADFALVTFIGNGAASGGAVASSGTAPANGAIHFSSCQFRQNTAATDGGAIVNSAHLFLLECTLESNTAGSLGGGIRQLETGDTTIFTSRFCMNTPENISGAYTAVGENILSGDCNGNGLCDADEIAAGTLADCNTNGIPDSCDIAGGTPDCNSNGVPDSCDIAGGTSTDVDSNGIPDECKPDCNNNDIPDAYEIATGATPDCNTNGIPDSCDIAANASLDCNANGRLDSCELADGTVRDCNSNGVIDSCEIATGAADADNDGRLDRCEIARGDLNLDGVVNSIDIAIVLTYWGPTTTGQGDTNFDGVIDSRDIAVVLSGWGVVPNF